MFSSMFRCYRWSTCIKQPRENYNKYRKGFPPTNVQALYFLVEWHGSVHDPRIFLRSTVHNMLRNEVISKCEKVIFSGQIPEPVCILEDVAYQLLLFLMKEYPRGGKDSREKVFG